MYSFLSLLNKIILFIKRCVYAHVCVCIHDPKSQGACVPAHT